MVQIITSGHAPLKAELAKSRPLEPVVVQIERRGRLPFIFFEME